MIKKFISFTAYKKAVQALGIKTSEELRKRYKEIPGAPSAPDVFYAEQGWKGKPDLFGSNSNRHGDSTENGWTPEYMSWRSMRARCNNPNFTHYDLYGGAGVRICERWDDYRNFLTDMGRRPTPAHSLGRFGDTGNYEPGNCSWQSPKEQAFERARKHRMRAIGKTINGYRILSFVGDNRHGRPFFRILNTWTGVEFVQNLDVIQATTSKRLGDGRNGRNTQHSSVVISKSFSDYKIAA